jgi:hypothetical protein
LIKIPKIILKIIFYYLVRTIFFFHCDYKLSRNYPNLSNNIQIIYIYIYYYFFLCFEFQWIELVWQRDTPLVWWASSAAGFGFWRLLWSNVGTDKQSAHALRWITIGYPLHRRKDNDEIYANMPPDNWSEYGSCRRAHRIFGAQQSNFFIFLFLVIVFKLSLSTIICLVCKKFRRMIIRNYLWDMSDRASDWTT